MLINLLTLMTGIVGLITTAIAVVRQKANPVINKYLIIILSVLSIRFLFRGLGKFQNTIPTGIFDCLNAFILILMCAFTHLYFRDLVFNRKWKPKDLLHLIIPSTIAMLYLFNASHNYEYDESIRFLYFTLFLISYLSYNYYSYKLLYKNIWNKKSDVLFENKQKNTIKNWTLYMFSAIVLLGLIIILVFIFNDFKYNSDVNTFQIAIASLFWLVFFIKLLATPELLYGYDFMKIKTDLYKKSEVILENIWTSKTTSEITNQKDLKIADIVSTNLNNYISQIENLSLQTDTFRNPTITIEDFAKKLQIPIVHLLYVFKYHCTLTFVEYKKLIRIQDALKLLEHNFLKTNTMEALAQEVGFSSYKPFYTHFKLVTGLNPHDYHKSLK